LVKDAAKNFVDKFAGSKTKMAVIQYYKVYTQWCSENGEYVLSNTKLEEI